MPAKVKKRGKHKGKSIQMSKRKLTQRQIYLLARSVGLSVQNARIASAVAMAESGGEVAIENTSNSDGSVDTGLWQINSIHGISRATLKTSLGNARAMKRISSNGKNWSPWVAFTNGSYRQYLGKAAKLKGGKAGKVPADGAGAVPSAPSPSASTATPEQIQTLASFEGGLVGTTLPMDPLGILPGVDPMIPGLDSALDIPGMNLLLPQQLEDFFTDINQIFTPRFWYQVGKVLLGVYALYLGLSVITKMSTGIDPGATVKKAVGTAASIAATKGKVK